MDAVGNKSQFFQCLNADSIKESSIWSKEAMLESKINVEDYWNVSVFSERINMLIPVKLLKDKRYEISLKDF